MSSHSDLVGLHTTCVARVDVGTCEEIEEEAHSCALTLSFCIIYLVTTVNTEYHVK